MNNNIIRNTSAKNILIIIGIIILFINCLNSRVDSNISTNSISTNSISTNNNNSISTNNNKLTCSNSNSISKSSIEPFINTNQAYTGHLSKRCTSTYGKYHPKCMQLNKLNHIGYFKLNTTKYPLIDINDSNSTLRYVMFKDKFIKLNKKYWDKGYYFKKSFNYDINIPSYIILNFLYRGVIVNTYNNKIFYIFGKKLDDGTYKYILFRKKNNCLYLSFNLPPRNKLLNGDTMYIRDKISTFGPFIYYKK